MVSMYYQILTKPSKAYKIRLIPDRCMGISYDDGPRILVVDDFSTIRRILIRILNEGGYFNTCEASDGNVAFDVLNSQRVDLVLTDLIMGNEGTDGLTFAIRVIQEIDKGNERYMVPFIFITAEGQREYIMAIGDRTKEISEKIGLKPYIERLYPYQFPFFLPKPASSGDLLGRVDNIFQALGEMKRARKNTRHRYHK